MSAPGKVVQTMSKVRVADAKRDAALHAAATWVRLGARALASHEAEMLRAIKAWVLAESDAGRC